MASMTIWDSIRATPTVIKGNFPNGAHESLLRAYQVLAEVRGMVERGDSHETVAQFINWATSEPPQQHEVS
jgi:hypothetical protein